MRAALALLAVAAAPADPLVGRVAGTPADCIELDRVQGPEPQPDGAILYPQSGARVWRMTPQGRCEGLRFDTRLIADVVGRRFCRGDLFRLFRPERPFRWASAARGALPPTTARVANAQST